MIGQDAVRTAQAFDEGVDFTGVVLSKLDGDARGGAALSVASVTPRRSTKAGTSRAWCSPSSSATPVVVRRFRWRR